MTDAELIRVSRKMFNLNQEQFAALIGFSASSVHSWEAGRRGPRLDAFRAILEVVISRSVSTASRQSFINETVKQLKAKAVGGNAEKE